MAALSLSVIKLPIKDLGKFFFTCYIFSINSNLDVLESTYG